MSSLFGGLGRMMVPERCRPWTHEEEAGAGSIASSAIRCTFIAGALGDFIGLIAMLQNLVLPSATGPAVAVIVLSAFYSLMFVMLWFLPINRRFS